MKKGKIGCLLFIILSILPPILIPLLWYKNDLKYKSSHIMSHTSLTGIEKILDSVTAHLSKSPLYDPHQQFDALLADGHFEYSLFAPFSRDAFAATYPLFNTTFVTETNVERDLVHSSAKGYNVRTLTGILTHEFTHQMFNSSKKEFAHDDHWKIEGYCDYLAHESSFDSTLGMQWLRAGKSDDSSGVPHSYEYFINRKLIEYELDTKRMTLDQVMNDPRDREVVLAEYRISLH